MSAAHTPGPLTALITAIRPMVAMTFDEAAEAEHHGKRLMYCRLDVLNPCWDQSYSASGWGEYGPGKHWGGGDACDHCNLRAAIAKAIGSAP